MCVRAYFKQDLQLHKTLQSADWQSNNCTFYIAHFDFITAQIVISCTLKYALVYVCVRVCVCVCVHLSEKVKAIRLFKYKHYMCI